MKTAVISLKVLPNHKKVLQERAVENGLTLSKYIISVLFPEQKIKKEFTPLPLVQKPLKQRLKEELERRKAPQLSQADVEDMVKRNKKHH
tara:strand:+ start:1232 stop:1501 length:270 start_codon:yes stop_codon:yes gene_type:complete